MKYVVLKLLVILCLKLYNMIVGIFDLNSLLFRYCLSNKYGGFMSVINKIQYITLRYNLEQIYLIRDSKCDWRKNLLNQYKNNRIKTKEQMQEFFYNLNALIDLLNQNHIHIMQISDYEADDVIASLVKVLSFKNQILIITNDKDLLQIPDCHFLILKPQSDVLLQTPEGIKNLIGVYPNQIVDYLSLAGDAADNIPGITGIGKKRAQKLIKQYCNIENIFHNITSINYKMQNILIKERFMLFTYKEVVRVYNLVPIYNLNYYIIGKKDMMKI